MARGFRALLLRFLAVWDDLRQKQIGSRIKLNKNRVSRILGLDEIEDGDYEKILSTRSRRRSSGASAKAGGSSARS